MGNGAGAPYAHAMPQRCFPRPWRFEPIPGGYRAIDANGLALAHVYGQPPDGWRLIAMRPSRKPHGIDGITVRGITAALV
jgi:hypothetical protein